MYRSLLSVVRCFKLERSLSQELKITTRSFQEKCINRVQILGRVACDPTTYSSPDGVRKVVFFDVVTQEKSRTRLEDGSVEEEEQKPGYHSFVVKRPGFTDYVVNNVTKGSRVYCTGVLQNRVKMNEDGTKKTVVNVVLYELVIMEKKRNNEQEVEIDIP